MSLGYAQRLSEYPDKGKCGLPETYDNPRVLAGSLKRLEPGAMCAGAAPSAAAVAATTMALVAACASLTRALTYGEFGGSNCKHCGGGLGEARPLARAGAPERAASPTSRAPERT